MMIDLKNKPEGATHNAGQQGGGWYKKIGDTWYFFNRGSCVWLLSVNSESWHDFYCIQLEPDWSIHNNTLPLSELSDERRGLLFNHKCNGGDIMSSRSGTIFDSTSNPNWFLDHIYRAKQKTERELFIEAAKATGGGLSPTELELVHAMFNVGFKAPKVGE